MENFIRVRGARENNLKSLSVDIPKNKLVVITGLSGSGKSSLAFDTIYAEGQRRYLESLSSYARQFLGGNEKPDVDSIDGLSPSISIDQKTTSHNPRSTVGTVTEIYDYLRLLWARIGDAYCVNGHGRIEAQTVKQIVDKVLAAESEAKIVVMAPVAKNDKGTFKNDLEKLKKEGFLRVRIDGVVYSLDDKIDLDKNKRHNLDVVVDRIVAGADNQTRSRVFDAVEVALRHGKGTVVVAVNDKETVFSENYSCKVCGFAIAELEPRLFSFNSPIGACVDCKGLGFTYEADEDLLVPNKQLSINDGGIDYFKNTVNTTAMDWQGFDALLKFYKIDKNKPLARMTRAEMDIIMNGSKEEIPVNITSANGIKYSKMEMRDGVAELIKRRHMETASEAAREFYSKYMAEKPCKSCGGMRLGPQALAVKIGKKSVIELTNLSIADAIDFFVGLTLTPEQQAIAELAMKEIVSRLTFLNNVGLSYLTLSRTASTLSGGESQRIRLATQIGSHLTGVLYVLDEPSIGLHQKDNDRLIETLKRMRDLGNTLIIVEHDEDTMRHSDYLIDIGPGAGSYGGRVVAQGTPAEVAQNSKSITGQYLSGAKSIPVPAVRRGGNGKVIVIRGASGNNLRNVDLTIPLGKFVAVTGVSGSGKSTIINETFVKAVERLVSNPFTKTAPFRELKGIENVDKIVTVSQDPIGRTPRSNPATYVGVFDDIRDVYASTPEAKSRGYEKGRFSFNVRGGRCERCQGDGLIRIEMHFLPDVYVKCEDCGGRRYNEETLQVKYKGKSIYEVLEMSVDEALEFFSPWPNIHKVLSTMHDVGLGYIKLGASATALSGGEAQRIKLAKFLQRRVTGKTIFALDEPTTGLHSDDVRRLIEVLDRIVDGGDTVIVIEHNLDIIKVADHVIDMGPDGGEFGGRIIATGTPEQVTKVESSYTGAYLKRVLQTAEKAPRPTKRKAVR